MLYPIPVSEKVRDRLAEIFAGYELRFVGGACRDSVFARLYPDRAVPHKDVDLATTATPNEMLELAQKHNVHVIPTGLAHGTLSFVLFGETYEITTLRIDTETDGRHAEVEYTTDWELDSARRDFSINSMSMSLQGEMFDYHGGEQDLRDGIVRFVGAADDRIQEDFLRAIRWFRFDGRYRRFPAEAALDLTVDHDALTAIQKNAHGLQGISGERIWSEMAKILQHPSAPQVIALMDQTGVFPHMGIQTNGWEPRTDQLEAIQDLTTNPVTRLAAVFFGRQTKFFSERWKVSREEFDLYNFLVNSRGEYTLSEIKQIALRHGLSWAIELAALHDDRASYWYLQDWELPVFPVGGRDLIERGVVPGPQMGAMLERMKTLWAKSDYRMSREELLGHPQTTADLIRYAVP